MTGALKKKKKKTKKKKKREKEESPPAIVGETRQPLLVPRHLVQRSPGVAQSRPKAFLFGVKWIADSACRCDLQEWRIANKPRDPHCATLCREHSMRLEIPRKGKP